MECNPTFLPFYFLTHLCSIQVTESPPDSDAFGTGPGSRSAAMQTVEPKSPGVQSGYRGRVRSGCLTCRSRKVKCDELRPACHNCTRLKRRCVYKPRKSRQYHSPPSQTPEQLTPDGSISTPGSLGRPVDGELASQQYPSPLSEEQDGVLTDGLPIDGDVNIAGDTTKNPFLSPDSSIVDITARLEKALRRQDDISRTSNDAELESATPSTLISRDIELTTTMDVLAIREVPLQPSFSFFVDKVDFPAITPFDGINWRRMKSEVVGIGTSNEAVAEAIVALSTLYKGQMYGLPLFQAMRLYRSAKATYEKLLDDTQHFDTVLVATFLLSLFEIIQYSETAPLLREPGEKFFQKLKDWTQYQLPHSSLAIRIIAWLRLLHTTTIRGGGMGLISDDVYNLFSGCCEIIPNLAAPSNEPPDTSTNMYEMLATPIFDFYFQLQMMSSEVAKLTHYHRSRTTGVDQKDVVEQIIDITSRLHALWDTRSATQRQTPQDLRAHLAHKIADPIITLIGMCHAVYYAEFIEIGRVLGDPVSESAESRQAMHRLREIVDGDWNAQDGGVLKTGYLRPLFLYAIECMNRDENKWAVERLERIKNPICRSDFFAAFARELSEAQLRKERRVTSKFFCIWYFGVPPPFL